MLNKYYTITMAMQINWLKMRFEMSMMHICLVLLFCKAANTFAHNRIIDLYEGSSCNLNNKNEKGECVLLPQCPSILEQVLRQERRATDERHCGFKGPIEIVCCPVIELNRHGRLDNLLHHQTEGTTKFSVTSSLLPATTKTSTIATTTRPSILNFLRPADVACSQYEAASTGEDTDRVFTHITNGERAAFGEFPYMVALGYLSDDNLPELRYICGGTLIAKQYILTAAHCVNNIDNLVPVEVKLGIVNLKNSSEYEQNIEVKKIITHPSYKRSLNYYDIAIIELQRPVIMSKTVMPICLQSKPLLNLETLADQDVLVTGWGATSLEGDGTDELQKTSSLSIVNTNKCNMFYEGFSKLPHGLDDSMICVLDKNVTRSSDACQGDSGGPLLLKGSGINSVIGVTSFGQSCGSRVPAVYTSVYYYLDWIEKIVWPKNNTSFK